MTDVPCAFFVLLAIFAYLRSLRRPAYFLLCGIAIGLMILTRSVVGLLPLGVFLLYSPPKSGGVARSAGAVPYPLTGLALAFAIPGVWYASQYAMHGDAFISGHLRFTESKLFAGHLTMPQRITGLLTYPKLLLRGYWPWVPLLALGFVKQLRRTFSGDRALRCCLCYGQDASCFPSRSPK